MEKQEGQLIGLRMKGIKKKQKEKGENTENGPGSKFKLHQRV
jgi:hypothetical protein